MSGRDILGVIVRNTMKRARWFVPKRTEKIGYFLVMGEDPDQTERNEDQKYEEDDPRWGPFKNNPA